MRETVRDHSLTSVLPLTGIGWLVLYLKVNLWRMLRFAWNRPGFKTFLVVLVANLSYRSNQFLDRRIYANRPKPAERRSHPSA